MALQFPRDKTFVRTIMVGGLLLIGSIAGTGQAAAGQLIPLDDTGGPGGSNGVATTWAQTANARSIALIESKEAPGGILAGIPAAPSRIPYEESERAVAQNRNATIVMAPHQTSPNQHTF